MPSSYPNALDVIAVDKGNTTPSANDHPGHHNQLAEAVMATQAELGLNPSGEWSTLAARLAASAPSIPLAEFFGHSLTVTGSPDTYVEDLCAALGVRRRNNRGWGGSISCWPVSTNLNAVGDGGYPWVLREAIRPGSPGYDVGGGAKEAHPDAAGAPYLPRVNLALHHQALNDLAELGSTKPRPMIEAHRTIWSRLCAAAVYEATGVAANGWTYTGTWGTLGGHFSGGMLAYTSTLNDKLTFTIPADFPSGLVIAIPIWWNAAWATTTIGVKVNGVSQPDLVITPSQVCDTEIAGKHNIATMRLGRASSGSPLSPLDYPVSLVAGQSIELTLKSGNGLVVECAQIEADPADGPLLVVPRPNRCLNYTTWNTWPHGPNAGTDPMNDAAVVTWDTALQALAAEFPDRTLMVDIDTALNKNSAYFSSGGAHLNAHGNALVARTIRQAVLDSGKLTARRSTAPFVDPSPYFHIFGHGNASAFENSWTSTTGRPAGYVRDLDGVVYLKGAVTKTTGAATDTITTLERGYRPAQDIDRLVPVWNGAAWQTGILRIYSTGVVQFISGGSIAAGNVNVIVTSFLAER